MHDELLKRAEDDHSELLKAYAIHNEQRERFHALLGMEATGSEAIGLARKYGPMLLKYIGAGGAGAGALAGLGNIFPKLASVLGMG